ncbi:MAG: hypothetical protein KBS84_09395, partial [Treponema sp.]|nr:hypothetical protein [Candidatus Treponema scatequi]
MYKKEIPTVKAPKHIAEIKALNKEIPNPAPDIKATKKDKTKAIMLAKIVGLKFTLVYPPYINYTTLL